jgi:hypothetical protein
MDPILVVFNAISLGYGLIVPHNNPAKWKTPAPSPLDILHHQLAAPSHRKPTTHNIASYGFIVGEHNRQ